MRKVFLLLLILLHEAVAQSPPFSPIIFSPRPSPPPRESPSPSPIPSPIPSPPPRESPALSPTPDEPKSPSPSPDRPRESPSPEPRPSPRESPAAESPPASRDERPTSPAAVISSVDVVDTATIEPSRTSEGTETTAAVNDGLNFSAPSKTSESSPDPLSGAAIGGIVAGVIVFFAIMGGSYFAYKQAHKKPEKPTPGQHRHSTTSDLFPSNSSTSFWNGPNDMNMVLAPGQAAPPPHQPGSAYNPQPEGSYNSYQPTQANPQPGYNNYNSSPYQPAFQSNPSGMEGGYTDPQPAYYGNPSGIEGGYSNPQPAYHSNPSGMEGGYSDPQPAFQQPNPSGMEGGYNDPQIQVMDGGYNANPEMPAQVNTTSTGFLGAAPIILLTGGFVVAGFSAAGAIKQAQAQRRKIDAMKAQAKQRAIQTRLSYLSNYSSQNLPANFEREFEAEWTLGVSQAMQKQQQAFGFVAMEGIGEDGVKEIFYFHPPSNTYYVYDPELKPPS